MHTTNYFDTFLIIAPDSSATQGTPPGERAATARFLFDLIHLNPYRHTSDDALYAAHVQSKGHAALSRQQFFAKGQACLRASALTKTLGWGVHCDTARRIALYGVETKEYRHFARNLPTKPAMRSKRA